MCEYCHSYPHMHGCPAEREKKALHMCRMCGEPIGAEEMYRFGENYYHCECVDELRVSDILSLLGIEKEREE